MDSSREANNKNSSMNSLPMLVSLIETAIKEKSIDRMYNDFLEEGLKMGLSSYTINILIINAKKRLENDESDDGDDVINPFIYRIDIIKPKPEFKYIYKVIFKNKRGFGFIISILFVLLIDMGILALYLINVRNSLTYLESKIGKLESKIGKIKSIVNIGSDPIQSFSSWKSTNNEHNSKSNKDYCFDVKSGDKISFEYDVSSEYNYDKLNVYLYTQSDTTNLMTKSGLESGTKTHSFNKDGKVTIRFEYSKDVSFNRYNDVVKVSNINIYRPFDVQINEIKKILDIK